MLFSKLNLTVEDYPNQGEYLLFNSRTQALIKINRELKEELDGLTSSKFPACPAGRKIQNSKLKENLAGLRENGIIVEDENEEEDKLRDFFQQLKYQSDILPFEATILTTYSCNFCCVYCFEESVKENLSLDKQSSELSIKWLIETIEKRRCKKVFLVYYGGEPLLNIPPIYQISSEIGKYAQKEGLDFGFGIITNGSLLKPRLVNDFLALGLRNIRVTIDGDREAHNRKRPFLGGEPTFDLIIENIKSVIDKVNISIAGNFDRENLESIPRLLDYLEKEGLLHKLSGINFAPLAPRLGPKTNPGAIELAECLSFFEKDGLFREIIDIKKDLLRRGVKINTGLAINACSMIMQGSAVTIDPKGDIYNCNALLGYPEFSVGNVRNPGFNPRAKEFLDIDAWDKCPKDCPYVPMCQGGCRFFSYLEKKSFSELSCKREYLDRIMPELIKLEYERLSQG